MEEGIRDKTKTLDQYYTKIEVADLCIKGLLKLLNNIDLKKYIFLESSAGYGCFIRGIKKRGLEIKAYDIDPKDDEIKKIDFLNTKEVQKEIKGIKKKIIAIGNPPFGHRSKIAINFFNQSALFAKYIAFIVPNHFMKWTAQKQLDYNFKLIYEDKLPRNSFYTEEKKDYNVNCVFQVWTKEKTKYEDKRIKEKPPITHRDFKMYQYNNTKEALHILNKDFDFAVFSQGYGDYEKLIYSKEEFNIKKQYLLFKAKNKKILSRLTKINFKKLAENNTTIKGFRKNDIVKEYQRKYPLEEEFLFS